MLGVQESIGCRPIERQGRKLDIGAHGTSVMGGAKPIKTDSIWSDIPAVSKVTSSGIYCSERRIKRANPVMSYLAGMLI